MEGIDNDKELSKIDAEFRKKFAKRLKKLRIERELTLNELAIILEEKYKVGVTYGSLGNYERASRIPDLYFLSKLSEFYNVTTDFLLGRLESRYASNDSHMIKGVVADDIDLESMSIKELNKLYSKMKNLAINFKELN